MEFGATPPTDVSMRLRNGTGHGPFGLLKGKPTVGREGKSFRCETSVELCVVMGPLRGQEYDVHWSAPTPQVPRAMVSEMLTDGPKAKSIWVEG